MGTQLAGQARRAAVSTHRSTAGGRPRRFARPCGGIAVCGATPRSDRRRRTHCSRSCCGCRQGPGPEGTGRRRPSGRAAHAAGRRGIGVRCGAGNSAPPARHGWLRCPTRPQSLHGRAALPVACHGPRADLVHTDRRNAAPSCVRVCETLSLSPPLLLSLSPSLPLSLSPSLPLYFSLSPSPSLIALKFEF